MVTTAIIGCNGYAGQETLDRVLAHPQLELVALGSDSLAGNGASALDVRLNGSLPAFVTNEEALASGAELVFLCLDHADAAAVEPPPDAVVVDLSGAHRLVDADEATDWYGVAPGAWSYGLPELYPPSGSLIANPGCYATAALLALAPLLEAIDPAGVVVDAKSGVSGAGRTPKPGSHAGLVLENFAPYAVGAHRHAPEIAQQLGFPVCFVPHLLPVRRGLLATCYVRSDDDLRALLEAAYASSPVVRVLPEGVDARAPARPGNGRGRDRRLRGHGDRHGDRHLRARQPRQGRRGPGRPEREPRARARRDARAPPAGSPRMSVTAAKGFVAGGVHAGIRHSRPDLAIVRSTAPAVGGAMWSRNRVQAACLLVNREHLSLAEPQAVVINSGVANSATGERGKLDALATSAEAARLLDLDAEEVLVLSTGVIGVPLPMGRLLPAPQAGRAGAVSGRGAGRGQGDHDHGHAPEGSRRDRGRLHRRRDGEGLRDDPSRSGDDARGRHDRLSARARRADRVPAAGRRGELQRDLGRRRLLDERRRHPARERRLGGRAHPRDRPRVRGRAAQGLPRPGRADRRRRRGRDRARRDRRHRRGRRPAGEGDRAADRDVGARQDGALRQATRTGAAC